MSYEGSTEMLCEVGHYHRIDCRADRPARCVVPKCRAQYVHFHEVDETNGLNENYHETHPANKIPNGFTEEVKTDHRGNEYYVKHDCFLPGFWKNNETIWTYKAPREVLTDEESMALGRAIHAMFEKRLSTVTADNPYNGIVMSKDGNLFLQRTTGTRRLVANYEELQELIAAELD